MVTQVKGSVSRDVNSVASRTALKAFTAYAGLQAILSGDDGGRFVFDGTDLSAQVTADTNEYNYIAPDSDATGASGAWVREGTVSVYSDTTELEGVGSNINTSGKVEGKVVKNVTSGLLVVAAGAAAGDTWNLLTGTVAHTPV